MLGTASQKQSLEIIAFPSLDNSPSCLSVPQTSEKWYTPSKGLSLTVPLQCCPFLHPTFCQVLKVQRVYDFFSCVICPWCCNHSSEVSCIFSRLQQQYAVMWDEAWTLLFVPPYFSVSNSCDPSKEPFPAALYTLRPSPESLQSCRSLSLLAGVHFLPAAVMSWILGVLPR